MTASVQPHFLVAIIDQENAVNELNEGNNLASVGIDIQPVNVLVAPESAEMRESYGVTLNVTTAGTSPVSFGLGPFNHWWEWIPKENPQATDPSFDDYLLLKAGDLVDLLVDQSQEILRLSQIPLWGLYEISALIVREGPKIAELFIYANTTTTIRYRVEGVEPTPFTATSADLTLNVPWDKQVLLGGALLARLVAPEIFKDLPPDGNWGIGPFPWLPPLVEWIRSKLEATSDEWYRKAYDPPNDNYRILVVPQPVEIPFLASIPAHPAREFALTLASILSLEKASAASRDRADGAAIAGDRDWQSRQLLAGAKFGFQSALQQTRLVGLGSTLAALGAFKDPDFGVNALRFLASSNLALARAELTAAIQMRIQDGDPVEPLTEAEVQKLAELKKALEDVAGRGSPSGAVYAATERYQAELLSVLERTNNLAVIEPDLTLAVGSLIAIQQSISPFISAPTIYGVSRSIASNGATQVILSFSQPLDVSSAETLSNYTVTTAGADGLLGTADDIPVGIAAARYDPSQVSVTLTTAEELSPSSEIIVSVRGSSPGGVVDTAGNLLDGDSDGRAGGDYSARIAGESMDRIAPFVKNIAGTGLLSQPTQYLVTFSESLSPTAAMNRSGYRLITPGRDGRFGTRDDQSISIKSAVYDATSLTVTLTPSRRIRPNERARLIIDGTTNTAVTDLAGNLLDGDGDGTAGGDYQSLLPPVGSGTSKRQDAFVTTLYNEVLGRAPEPMGRVFWSKQLARGEKPKSVATSFWNSRERRYLVQQHKAPSITFQQVFLHAKKAWEQARA